MGYRDALNTIHESYAYISIRSLYILQLHRDLYQYSEKSIGGRFKSTQKGSICRRKIAGDNYGKEFHRK